MPRLNEDRQKELEPKRLETAKREIESLGLQIVYEGSNRIDFMFKREKVMYYPYSGWATGKTIKDGRGLKQLLNQLKIV